MKKRPYLIFLLALAILFLVKLADIRHYLRENTQGLLWQSIVRTAEIVIPLKDRIMGQSFAKKLARLQSTGACKFCDLSEAVMEGMDLSGKNLHNADLIRADLSGSDLSGVYLYDGDLSEANLTEVSLYRATMERTIFYNRNFQDIWKRIQMYLRW